MSQPSHFNARFSIYLFILGIAFYLSLRIKCCTSYGSCVVTHAPCANVALDLTASVLLTPENQWDWITDFFTIEEVELVETSLASATFRPCRGTPGSDSQADSGGDPGTVGLCYPANEGGGSPGSPIVS